jgi:hypothetical protein
MAVYSVFEPPERSNDAAVDAERFAFVRDGFSFAAFLFGPIWMLWHRMWIVFVGYLGAGVLLAAAFHLIAASGGARSLAGLLLSVLVGLEAASLRRWTLIARGWRDQGIVVADDLEAAERRFFAAWVPPVRNHSMQPPPPSSPPLPPAPKLRMPAGDDVIGLFPEPGASR